jgi:acetate kinase
MPSAGPILTLNVGSSSLKAGVYDAGAGALQTAIHVDRIGLADARLSVTGPAGPPLVDRRLDAGDHAAAARAMLDWLGSRPATQPPSVIAHRVVHGGHITEPQLITSALLAELGGLVPIDPDHLPQALAVIALVATRYPEVPQVACFDTAFHRHMPAVAQMYALPAHLRRAGVRRYGFHGLSCESIVDSLRALDARAVAGRLVIAHLGNGASLTAVRDGQSVDTTMGFSPAGGVVMGTRTGDLDPGVLLFVLRRGKPDVDALNKLINHDGGLLGVSGTSSDMRDLLARASADPRAADAVALFCYTVRKALGALVAVLGGLDTLVFTGGIGEHAAEVRQRITAGLDALGIRLDPRRNEAHDPVVSAGDSRVVVRIMTSDEDRMLARHAARLLASHAGHNDR